MRGIIFGVLVLVLALMLVPRLAHGAPGGTTHGTFDYAVRNPGPDFDLTCSTGGPASLAVGVAVLGLALRKRR
jgi:uncharacterized protein (TIGR03382 family)